MPKNLLSYLFLTFIAMFGTAFADETNFRPKLGCIPFLATSIQAMAFTENLSSSLLNSIDRSRYFEIVERKKIEQFLELEGLRLDNLNNDSIIKIGDKAGLDYIVHGSVSMTESGAVLDVNLLHIRSRKSVMKESFRISESDFSRRLNTVADSILDKARNAGSSTVSLSLEASSVTVPVPKNVVASGTTNSIRLEWQCDNLKQIAGFNIYRAADKNGQYSQHATTADPVFIDENLKLNEDFFYRIVAVGQTGAVSEMTLPVRGATSIAPTAPIFMNAEADIKGARLNWRPRPGATGDIRTTPSGYRVYRRQGDNSPFAMIARLPVDAVTFADTGLSEGIKYIYTITAHNNEGAESEYSAKLSVMPLPPPGKIRATGSRIRQIPLSWDQYPSETAEGYMIYRSEVKDGRYAMIAKLDRLTAAASYIDSTLADNTTYWYKLSVYKKGGLETATSEPVSAVTRDIPPPPHNLTARSGEPRRVKLSWQLSVTAEDEIKKIIIYRTMDEKTGTMDKVDEISSSKTDFVDDTPPLQDKTTYYYRLCSQNSGGATSSRSEKISATTKAPPNAPVGLSAVSGEVKKITLRWEKNKESDIKLYQIFRKRGNEADFKELHELSDTQYEDTLLPDGSEMSYKIRATDTDGLTSLFSEPVNARTRPLPAKVSNFKIADAVNRIVTWQPNQEKDVHNYNIYKKGFLGIPQKLDTAKETSWKLGELNGKLELYVTAVDDSGLESEFSEMVAFE